jgi:hypothetical protein
MESNVVTQMQLMGDEYRVTISKGYDYHTARECVENLEAAGSRQVESLLITLVAIEGVPAGLIGLMLWLKEKSGARRSRIKLVDCDTGLWRLLSMTEIMDAFSHEDIAECRNGAPDSAGRE